MSSCPTILVWKPPCLLSHSALVAKVRGFPGTPPSMWPWAPASNTNSQREGDKCVSRTSVVIDRACFVWETMGSIHWLGDEGHEIFAFG